MYDHLKRLRELEEIAPDLEEGRSYCRGCDKYHEADGVCGYHNQQFAKLQHAEEKRAGVLNDPEYQEEKRRFWK